MTLNRTEAIDPEHDHPQDRLLPPGLHRRGRGGAARHASIGGWPRTHYCGAYWGWGFHEDGVQSALRACAPFGVTL